MPPAISIGIPVLNEADGSNELILHLRALPGAEMSEIIVVDGDPRGGTIRALEDPSVLCLTAPAGRAFQRNARAFPDISIMEDVQLMRNVKKSGHKIRILPHRVRTSARR
jgi:glycosyltransferase involved in cell wall biosynthesis